MHKSVKRIVCITAVLLFLLNGSTRGVESEPAPDFNLRDTYGQPISLKAYRGSVLWITFGASW